ncbi:glycine receptor subunit alpha-2 [Eurytemora carolleeae]|uniref:glycine receptor subunit alpha-2 n=1 Tax=Eurytemora carolleeae TaxID=1294199 RepID=UPI000C7644B9|nr:glycine receptor subunit alpha-2 [Eurytemora carolleeae]|eukprot:XP_023326611.1 glycine receptor subunit alpha-2-like [Eurytemora affinis]
MIWELIHLQFGTFRGFLFDDTERNYPVGRYLWNISDPDCFNTIQYQQVYLTLTRCSTVEFTCDDGTCIPLVNRCNITPDCPDNSDEVGCRSIIQEESYDPFLPAPSGVTNEPLPVELDLGILVDKIIMKDLLLTIMIKIQVNWKDKRITFQNLRDDPYQNILTDEEVKLLWKPTVYFDNAKNGQTVQENTIRLLAVKKGSEIPFQDSYAVEEARYDGANNFINMTIRFYAEYFCDFDLTYFPFDVQKCFMDFKLRTATKKFVKLNMGRINYEGSKKMVEFSIINISTIDLDADNRRSTQRLVILFERDYFYYMTQSFLTTFVLGMLAYSTFFINIDDFNDRFMGSLTALLVLATLTSVYTADLPKTSYFKVIDIWLQFFVISTAVNISVHVIVDNLRKKETKENDELGKFQKVFDDAKKKDLIRVKRSKMVTARRVNSCFIIFFPIILILFTIFMLIYVMRAPEVSVYN